MNLGALVMNPDLHGRSKRAHIIATVSGRRTTEANVIGKSFPCPREQEFRLGSTPTIATGTSSSTRTTLEVRDRGRRKLSGELQHACRPRVLRSHRSFMRLTRRANPVRVPRGFECRLQAPGNRHQVVADSVPKLDVGRRDIISGCGRRGPGRD